MKWLILGVCLVNFLGWTQGREASDARLIIATRTTKTAYVLTTSTTTTPFTCAFLTNADVCQRRRFRRFSLDPLKEVEGTSLDGSMGGIVDDGAIVLEKNDRKARIALTIWSTVSSTVTVTSTSMNSATTFSLSFFCTVNGATLPPTCG